MHPERPALLTQAELLRLEGFLRSEASGEGAMSLSRAHGFLTAIVSGPERFEAGEWIRLIFDEPVFSDSEQAQDILGLIMRLHAHIGQVLPVAGSFSPIFEYVQDRRGTRSCVAEEWCEGYLSAIDLWSAPLPRALRQTMEPLFLIANPPGGIRHTEQDARYAELCATLPVMAESIYQYWRSQE
jgi:uncharacterized protein